MRLFTFVPDAGEWVEWLQASDPTGERWADVNVLETTSRATAQYAGGEPLCRPPSHLL